MGDTLFVAGRICDILLLFISHKRRGAEFLFKLSYICHDNRSMI